VKRLFLMSFDPTGSLNISLLFAFINAMPQVLNWRAPGLPGTVLLASRLGVRDLAELLRGHMGGYKFLLLEIGTNSIDGWVEQATWDFVWDPPELPPVKNPAGFGLLSHRKD